MDGENPKAVYSQNLRTELARMFAVDTAQVRIQSIAANPYTPETGFTYSVVIAVLPSVTGIALSADDVTEAFEGDSTTTLTIAEHPFIQIGTPNVIALPEQQDVAPPPPAPTPGAAQFLGRHSLVVSIASHRVAWLWLEVAS